MITNGDIISGKKVKELISGTRAWAEIDGDFPFLLEDEDHKDIEDDHHYFVLADHFTPLQLVYCSKDGEIIGTEDRHVIIPEGVTFAIDLPHCRREVYVSRALIN